MTLIVLVSSIVWISLLITLFGWRVYKDLANPITVFVLLDIGVYTLLSALIAVELSGGVGMVAVLIGALIYLIGFALVFLLPQFAAFGHFASRLVAGVDAGRAVRFSIAKLAVMVICCVLLFGALIALSSAGILWLTDPRLAYITGRAGVGPIFLMLQWGLMAMLVYVIWTLRPGLLVMAVCCVLYSAAALLTGSKANVLCGWIFAALYYHFYVRKFPAAVVIFAPVAAVGMVAGLLYLQGSYSSVVGAFAYFRDYAEVAGLFLSRFDEFSYQFGYGMLSSLWFYVPRALVNTKPYEYGLTLIHAQLFPGSAAQGHTAGILPWALSYLDFGYIGVAFSGFIVGIVRRAIYEAFLANRNNIFAFMLMVQITMGGIFAYATLPLMIVLGLILSTFYCKRVVL